MNLIPLKNIDDTKIFYKGTRFRIYNIGLNVKDKSEDFYEYMLTEISGDTAYMQLTNIVGHKSGSILSIVKTTNDKTKFVVTGQAIKLSMGIHNTYLLEDN